MGVDNREFGLSLTVLTWGPSSPDPYPFTYRYSFKTIDMDLTCEMMRARAAQDIANPDIKGWDYPLVRERMFTIDMTGVVPALNTQEDIGSSLFDSAMKWAAPAPDFDTQEIPFTIITGYMSISGQAVAESTGLDYGGEAGEARLRLLCSNLPTFSF